jgi:hypothetical protein
MLLAASMKQIDADDKIDWIHTPIMSAVDPRQTGSKALCDDHPAGQVG